MNQASPQLSREGLSRIILNQSLWTCLFILAATVLAIVLNGYRFGINDQALYIPWINKFLQPELYKHDFLFSSPQDELTLVLPLIAKISSVISMEWLFFVGYVLSLLGVNWAIYKIAYSVTNSRTTGIFAVIALLLFIKVGGTATSTFDHYFTLRSTAMPFALFVIYYFIERKYIYASLCGSIGFLIHPLTILMPISAVFLYLLINIRWSTWLTFAKPLMIFFLLTCPLTLKFLFFQDGSDGGNILSFASPQWLEILHKRNDYLFPSLWEGDEWFHLIIYSCLILISIWTNVGGPIFREINQTGVDAPVQRFAKFVGRLRVRNDEKLIKLSFIAFVSLLFLVLAYLFADVYPLPLTIALQFSRGLCFLYYIAMILFVIVLSQTEPENKFIPLLIAGLVFTGLSFMVILGIAVFLIFCVYDDSKIWIKIIALSIFTLPIFVFRGFFAENLGLSIHIVHLIGILIIASVVWAATIVLGKVSPRSELSRWSMPVSALLSILFVTNASGYLNPSSFLHQVNMPGTKVDNPWIIAQRWVEANTKKDALFLVPIQSKGFRIYSKRASVGDLKDGAPTTFSEEYAIQWNDRMADLRSYYRLDENQIRLLKAKYQATHMITKISHQLNFPTIYKNDKFVVYQL